MKIRLVGPGYNAFTGDFGGVQFENGVSAFPVSPVQARLFASITSVENVEDGVDPGENAQFQSSFNLEAVSVNLPTLAELQASGEAPAEAPAKASTDQPVVSQQYNQEQLEAIADKGGIAALREVAEKFGIKGTSIAKLIEGILKAQAPAAPEATTLGDVPPIVLTEDSKEPETSEASAAAEGESASQGEVTPVETASQE